MRVLEPGGTLVLAVYLKTPLTFIHEAIRRSCLRMPKVMKRSFYINGFTGLVKFGERLGHTTNVG